VGLPVYHDKYWGGGRGGGDVSANSMGLPRCFISDSSASVPSSFCSGPGKFAPVPLVAPAHLGGCSQILSARVLTRIPGHRSVFKPAALPVSSDLVPGAAALGNKLRSLPVMTECSPYSPIGVQADIERFLTVGDVGDSQCSSSAISVLAYCWVF
jgi:hypothetical protein